MRIITWNCKGAFERKRPVIDRLRPDILVVPEAGPPSNFANVPGAPPARTPCWIGDGKKGLGVFSYGDYSLSIDPGYDPSIRMILPLRVDGPCTFTLIAIWTVKDAATKYYITPLISAYERYCDLFERDNVVLAGDLNQSVCFDKRGSQLNFEIYLKKLESHQLFSMYHRANQCEHGREGNPTYFHHHKESRPHHIDFIFAKPKLFSGGVKVEVGQHAEWAKFSDHMPIICEFNNPVC